MMSTVRVITACMSGALAILLIAGCQSAPKTDATANESSSLRGVVAADHPVASEAGAEMLRLGGNAVDAAVATSFCLSVVRPESCGIGGGGFMLIVDPGASGASPTSVVVNYRETCPAAVGPDHFVSLASQQPPPFEPSRFGADAVAVPGTVVGLLWALANHGTLDRWTVLEPAIRAAEDGFRADTHLVERMHDLRERLAGHEHLLELMGDVWTQVLRSGQLKPGDLVQNPGHGRALRLIADQGVDAFVTGEIGQAIEAVMRERGGSVTKHDLASYSVAIARPLRGRFLDRDVIVPPPPSSGGVAMLQTLGTLQRRLADLEPDSSLTEAPFMHLLAECFKHAFSDRARWLADPQFVDVPVPVLLADHMLDDRAASISLQRTQSAETYGLPRTTANGARDDGGTSHFCVLDRDGMAVACTETINLSFGSLVCVPGFGFLLNNEMDDFTTQPVQGNAFGLVQSAANLPEPGKRPLSSMTPTIVLRDGQVELIAGGSGGPRIITAVTQALLHSILLNEPPREALAAPRFHHQWMPDVLEFEPAWGDRRARRDMEKRGHVTKRGKDWAAVQMIRVTPRGVEAASDIRKGGAPAWE